ncbi:HNH endonuclease [Candidatus Glomeribacter gigasporarum]|uniref:HNH endonuclease n=1 Tax=Candidatus Glomeribacter gigasporarum TaxID=132144 RepID=UPI0009DA17A4
MLFIDEETGWNIHHIQHQANGGTHQYNNLILMHPNCHRSIHAAKRAIRKPEVSKKRYFDEGLSRGQGNLHARF